MKVYIVKDWGYSQNRIFNKGFANKRQAQSYKSNYVKGLKFRGVEVPSSRVVIETVEIPITKKGILKAINL